jgi:hypothetical protein
VLRRRHLRGLVVWAKPNQAPTQQQAVAKSS